MVDDDDNIAMNLELIIVAAAAVAGIVATVSTVVRDGYHRVPTRRF